MLKVITLNLLNDLTYWAERSPLIVQELQVLSPDIIALQEVALPFNNAAWLAKQLPGYSIHTCPYSNQRGQREGLAILSRLPVENHAVLALGAQNRVAQQVLIRHEGHHLALVNTHLFWSPFDDPIRIRQIEQILTWVPQQREAVLCGDLNATPNYRAVQILKRHFASAYEQVHHQEPDFTFPTPLKRGPGLRHAARRLALGVIAKISNGPCPAWCGTLDYIFIKPPIKAGDCQLVFTQPAPDQADIYPSDHRGLSATLMLA